MPYLESASERKNRREKMIQAQQRGAKDKHEGRAYQYEHEKDSIENKPYRTANILPRVIMYVGMMR
jgi:hypothetical protein